MIILREDHYFSIFSRKMKKFLTLFYDYVDRFNVLFLNFDFFCWNFFSKKMKSFSPFQIYLCASIPDIIWCMHNGNSRKICANKKFLFIETSLAAYYLVITINMDVTIKQPSLLTNLKMRFTLADIVCAP